MRIALSNEHAKALLAIVKNTATYLLNLQL
jgi:hypothetical protein